MLDAAHNPDATRAVVRTLNNGQWPERPRVLVFGVSRDKDAEMMLTILLPEFDHVILTQIRNSPRSFPPNDLASMSASIRETAKIETAETTQAALRVARSAAKPRGMVCVTGSVFLAAEYRSVLLPK